MNPAETFAMDPILKQHIAEKRRRLNQRIQEAQSELEKLDQFEALGREIFSSDEASSEKMVVPIFSPPRAGIPPPGIGIRSFGRVTKKETILSTAAEVLSDGKRRSSKELLEELKTRGVDIGGTDPVNNLAAYLSPDERFESKRSEGGWGLVDPILR